MVLSLFLVLLLSLSLTFGEYLMFSPSKSDEFTLLTIPFLHPLSQQSSYFWWCWFCCILALFFSCVRLRTILVASIRSKSHFEWQSYRHSAVYLKITSFSLFFVGTFSFLLFDANKWVSALSCVCVNIYAWTREREREKSTKQKCKRNGNKK